MLSHQTHGNMRQSVKRKNKAAQPSKGLGIFKKKVRESYFSLFKH